MPLQAAFHIYQRVEHVELPEDTNSAIMNIGIEHAAGLSSSPRDWTNPLDQDCSSPGELQRRNRFSWKQSTLLMDCIDNQLERDLKSGNVEAQSMHIFAVFGDIDVAAPASKLSLENKRYIDQ